MKIIVAGLTDIGQHRQNNEDSLFVGDSDGDRGDRGDREQSLFIVADGVGGQPAGEVASRLLTDRLPPILLNMDGSTLDSCQQLVKAIQEANQVLVDTAVGKPEWQGMSTTVVAVRILSGEINVANVGDSRAYLVRNQTIKQISEDHTVLAEQQRLGVAEDELSTGMSHILTRCLGLDKEVEVSALSMPMEEGDRILLCSDGLTDSLSEEVIRSIVLSTSTPGEGCRMLVELANRNGGRDNITVLLIHFDKMTIKDKVINMIFRRK